MSPSQVATFYNLSDEAALAALTPAEIRSALEGPDASIWLARVLAALAANAVAP